MAEEYDYLFKSIVVGDGGVGKTALTLRFSKGFFTEDYKMTIGVDFHVKTISIDADEGPIRSKLQIWDTGGQERFSSIRPMYYRGSLGALLIFDLTNSATFDHLPQWIEEVRANVKTEIPLLLVGNKSDLVEERAITLEEINNFTHNFNLFYMETSAKTGEGVGDCFYILACLMIGSGVPDKLLSDGVVFGPGQISTIAPESHVPTSPRVQSDFDFSAPPVPEPFSTLNKEPEPTFKSESEFDYEAPPVPEPKYIEQSSTNPSFEPEIPIPEPRIEESPRVSKNFEFKTPDEILAEEKSLPPASSELPHFQDTKTPPIQEDYRPKAVPFTSSTPVRAPTPEAFQSPQETPAPNSDSLMDYMPEQVLSKKEKKRIEKQKKKAEKIIKAQEDKERQQKLIEEMKKSKKEKKEKPKKEKKEKPKKEKKEKKEKSDQLPTLQTPISTTRDSTTSSSLFQTLTQKPEEVPKTDSSPFVPFSKGKESQTQEDRKLRIIPNSAEIESKPSGFTPISPAASPPQERSGRNTKELIICKSCGAMLSSDYAFCNKCGSHL
ncbi:MAG: GTP-binding protein [Promethearchaeota archaeon]|jgi:Ras-related protein Rab-11A